MRVASKYDLSIITSRSDEEQLRKQRLEPDRNAAIRSARALSPAFSRRNLHTRSLGNAPELIKEPRGEGD